MTKSVQIVPAATSGNVSSFSVPIDTSATANRLLLVLGSIDGTVNPNTSSTGWQKFYYFANSDLGAFAFAKLGTGTSADALTISWTGGTEQLALMTYYIDDPPASISSIKYASYAPTAKQSNMDPPLLNTGVSAPYMWIAFGATDFGGGDATAAPTDFTKLTKSNTAGATTSSGQASFSAERQYTGASLDPSPFPMLINSAASTDNVLAATIAIPVPGVSGPEPGRFLLAA